MDALSSGIRASGERLEHLSARLEAFRPEIAGEVLAHLRDQHEELVIAHEALGLQVDELQRATERAELDRERYRTLFDLSPDAYFITDMAGVVRELNTAARQLFFTERFRELRGRPLAILVQAADAPALRVLLDRTRDPDGGEIDVRLRCDDDATRWISLKCVGIEGRTRLLWIARPRPSQARSGSPLKLGVAHQELVDERIRDLERALADKEEVLARERRIRRQVELTSRSKDRFIAALTHDLRAPIHAVLGWTRLLRGEVLAKEARDRALAMIEQQALAQTTLLEELLDLSRIITDEMRLEPVPLDLTSLVRRVSGSFAPCASDRRVSLACRTEEEGVTVVADRRRMEQAISNLVDNALKFVSAGGSVEISLARENASAVLRVKDDEQDLDVARLPTLFDGRRQEAKGKTAGGGLGLFVARHLVELHGGTVEAESEGLGMGAIFTIRIPLASASGAERAAGREPSMSPPSTPRASELANVRVLVVDDDADSRELLREVLRQSGAEVLVAASAEMARAMFMSQAADLLISDIGLPKEDGCKLVRDLRAVAPDLPAIAVTGYVDGADVERALDAGFDVHVAKPLDMSKLVRLARELTSKGP